MRQETHGTGTTPATAYRLTGLILFAYLFSIAVRMIWVQWAGGHPEFFWNGQLMINTNDGYFFASGVQHELWGVHADNPRIPGFWNYGVVALTTLLARITPFSLETIILYLPAVISSLVVIPVILIGRLFGRPWWGFFSALLGSVVWSYYNRTMVGYYDSDMFSAMAPMFILYFLMKSTVDFDRRSAFYAALAVSIYPFLYDQGRAIVFAMGLIYAAYLIWYHRRERMTYESLLLVFLALTPYKLPVPWEYFAHLLVVTAVYLYLRNGRQELRRLQIGAGVAFLLFLGLGNVFGLIWVKVFSYLVTGTNTENGLHFYAVNQTVREAGKIPFDLFARRISGSVGGLLLAGVGYALLVWRERPFLLALPLVGIGVFALWGGLRFTVYAVPVAALSALYLFVWGAERVGVRWARIWVPALAALALLVPNIQHIVSYKVPTVFNRAEVRDLVALNEKASGKDYTIAWWDYGYPLWFYSDTSTLIDGGKHNEDNFIVSRILQTDSPALAANLARLAVERYANDPKHRKVAPEIFRGKDPETVLAELEASDYPLPPKSREVYLYLPYRMMGIFPTVTLFGNLNLKTGNALRKIEFYSLRPVGQDGALLKLSNGLQIDIKRGELISRGGAVPLKRLTVARVEKDMTVRVREQKYHADGRYSVVYLESYGRVVLMDNTTYRSIYVQMFMLGQYDPKFFEPVVLSPYTRIYRLKK